jgi:5-methylcytosine-specific restriction protein A
VSEPRNPVWSRDELILALELYFRRRDRLPDENDPEVVELSAVLRRMAGSAGERFKNFRSTSAVAMKLANIQSIDPAYTQTGKKGLPGGGRGDGAVWTDFADRPAELRQTALAIRAAVDTGHVLDRGENDTDDGEDEAQEGRILTQIHKRRERSKKLIALKKKNVLKQTGKLSCEGCGFEFKAYGSRGEGFVEVHHTRPVHQLRTGDTTHLDDLAMLCANCHRIVHRMRPWLTLDELKQIAPKSNG